MVAIITGYGINADRELGTAFEAAGADVDFLHLSDCIENPELLASRKIIAFPGGFSFGDHIGSGTIFAHVLKNHLEQIIKIHLQNAGLIIGICNGFQVLVKMGLLPNTKGNWENQASLIHNSSGKFIDKWVDLEVNNDNSSPWLEGIENFDCPVRHGEGQFIVSSELGKNFPQSQIAFRYSENPNGSFMDIAGITDGSGRILGMMPHPEAFIRSEQHPYRSDSGIGLKLFQNAVNYVKNSPS